MWDLLWRQGDRLECCSFSKKSESYKLWQWLSIRWQSADKVAHCENIVCFHWQQDRVDPGDKMWVTREETVWGQTSKGPGPRRRLIRQAGQKKENGRCLEWQKLMTRERAFEGLGWGKHRKFLDRSHWQTIKIPHESISTEHSYQTRRASTQILTSAVERAPPVLHRSLLNSSFHHILSSLVPII